MTAETMCPIARRATFDKLYKSQKDKIKHFYATFMVVGRRKSDTQSILG